MSITGWMKRHLRYEQAERLRETACSIMYYSGLGWLASLRRRPGATVLLYHSVGGQEVFSDNVIPIDAFEQQMSFISAHRKPIPLEVLVNAIRNGEDPDTDWVVVSFDDGYADFAAHAVPILERYGVPATMFIPTAVLDGEALFFDEIDAYVRSSRETSLSISLAECDLVLPLATSKQRRDASLRLALVVREMDPVARRKAMALIEATCGCAPAERGAIYLSDQDVRGFPPLISVGSHCVSHFSLPSLDNATLESELEGSKRRLEAVWSSGICYLAYPFGKPWAFDERVSERAKQAGYVAALTTVPGSVNRDTSLLQMPRVAGTASMSRFKLNLLGLHI